MSQVSSKARTPREREMAAVLREQASSGWSVAEFARVHGWDAGYLYTWRKRLRDRRRDRAGRGSDSRVGSQSVELIPVEIEVEPRERFGGRAQNRTAASLGSPITLELTSGDRILLPADASSESVAAVASLVEALRRCS